MSLFLFTQIELIEILIDGFSGKHRVFAKPLGGLYTVIINTIEVLSLLALIATIVFLVRRNGRKVGVNIERFHKDEMTLWPKLDANLILLGELALVTGIFLMNASDGVLQKLDPAHYPDTGPLLISGMLSGLLENLGKDLLMFFERAGWWLHALTVFAFINYLPRSKHLHIFLAFPNVYYSRLKPRGEMTNMDAVTNEVKLMLGLAEDSGEPAELEDFGAKDVPYLSWKTIMDAYSCTECGRCTSVCPANQTGKKLSPRKILMDIRDRTEEISEKIDSGDDRYFDQTQSNVKDIGAFDDGKSLFDYVSKEEIRACTTCNACVEACPILIDPLTPILEMRRYEILTEADGPPDWTPMFTNLENNMSPWQMTAERADWTKEIEK